MASKEYKGKPESIAVLRCGKCGCIWSLVLRPGEFDTACPEGIPTCPSCGNRYENVLVEISPGEGPAQKDSIPPPVK